MRLDCAGCRAPLHKEIPEWINPGLKLLSFQRGIGSLICSELDIEKAAQIAAGTEISEVCCSLLGFQRRVTPTDVEKENNYGKHEWVIRLHLYILHFPHCKIVSEIEILWNNLLKAKDADQFLPDNFPWSIFLLIGKGYTSCVSSLCIHKISFIKLIGNCSSPTFQEVLSPPFQEGLFNRFVSEAIDQEEICAETASLFHKNEASPSGSLKSKYAQPGFNYLW